MSNPELIAGRSLSAELTPQGELEAVRKGEELLRRHVAPDYVVSSPAIRCMHTGEIILRVIGRELPIEPIDELLEMDQGNYVGRVRTEVYTDDIQQQIAALGKDFALPGAESMNQVGARGLHWLRSQENKIQYDMGILAIAHAGLITHTVGAIENWDQPTSFAMLRSMSPVAETRLVFDGRDWQVEAFAESLPES